MPLATKQKKLKAKKERKSAGLESLSQNAENENDIDDLFDEENGTQSETQDFSQIPLTQLEEEDDETFLDKEIVPKETPFQTMKKRYLKTKSTTQSEPKPKAKPKPKPKTKPKPKPKKKTTAIKKPNKMKNKRTLQKKPKARVPKRYQFIDKNLRTLQKVPISHDRIKTLVYTCNKNSVTRVSEKFSETLSIRLEHFIKKLVENACLIQKKQGLKTVTIKSIQMGEKIQGLLRTGVYHEKLLNE